jgi:hypothetical protein
MKVSDDGVPVNALIDVIKESIREAGVSSTKPDRDLQVSSVQLVLKVVASQSAGGGLDFTVPFIGMRLSLGAKVAKKDTHTIVITLVPPDLRKTRRVRTGEIAEALVSAITTIRGVMTKAAEGDDPWVLETGTVDLSFAITKTGTISLGIDGELEHDLTQTLRLGLALATP